MDSAINMDAENELQVFSPENAGVAKGILDAT